MNEKAINRALIRIAREIFGINVGKENLALIGIHTGGAYLADRIADYLREQDGMELQVGKMDVTQYRDDASTSGSDGVQMSDHLYFKLDKRKIVLVDDVLYTGRTIRAALAKIVAYGRPDSVQLAVLVNRKGHNEMPICPDYVGKTISDTLSPDVHVKLKEINGIYHVVTSPKSQ